ncbi:hypothetical protein ACL07V_34935 [Streptomyces sp. MB22_4]|uniref:hypothetical protein n=1 Tax=Streptomyces sp. MB22_4 TaxID=3383120 RepID=UPI0039A075AE
MAILTEVEASFPGGGRDGLWEAQFAQCGSVPFEHQVSRPYVLAWPRRPQDHVQHPRRVGGVRGFFRLFR